MRVLVVNAGSSSLKLSVVEDGRRGQARELEAQRGEVDPAQLRELLDELGVPDAVGHRIVHGGPRHAEAAVVTEELVAELTGLADLAPLHQAKSLAALAAVGETLPDVPAVACFDTAFHAGLPAAAATYALPAQWRERWGLRRYGFHGLSHAYASRRAAELLGRPLADLRVVTCHLGAGASLAAVAGGRSVDTTMGFTPLEGLVMATRSGSVDPGLLLWLLERAGTTPAEMAHALEHESGLAALAGTSDLREVLGRAADGDGAAKAAVDVYVHRLRGAIAAMTAALGGLDALVFTGRIGERAPRIRAAAVGGLRFLGLGLDPQANDSASSDADVSSPEAVARSLVVATGEDLEIAAEVEHALR